jgi:hypothetical protein
MIQTEQDNSVISQVLNAVSHPFQAASAILTFGMTAYTGFNEMKQETSEGGEKVTLKEAIDFVFKISGTAADQLNMSKEINLSEVPTREDIIEIAKSNGFTVID